MAIEEGRVSEYIFFGSVIIDDILQADGQVSMYTLGGSGSHALMGGRVWSDDVAFVAGVGQDFAPEHWDQLASAGVNLSGMQRFDCVTARAWQLYEDDRRVEVFRTDIQDLRKMSPQPGPLPTGGRKPKGAYIAAGKVDWLLQWVEILRRAGVSQILWEPHSQAMSPQHRAEFSEALAKVDIVAPDIDAAMAGYRKKDAQAIAQAMHEDGAKVVALRMGKRGSLVSESSGALHQIPMYRTKVADVTGAGNSYCGGFLVGYTSTGDARLAGLYGAISASFVVEQPGLIRWRPTLRAEAEQRLRELLGQ